MSNPEVHQDILRRINELESRVRNIEERVINQEKVDVETKSEIKSLHKEFETLKTDVLSIIKDHTDRTWKLINVAIRTIGVLLMLILLVAGVKITPEIMKLMIGG